MSRESKLFSVHRSGASERIKQYESFGWELLSINTFNVDESEVSMTRETQNKVYPTLVKFEFEYEKLVEEQSNLLYPVAPSKFNILIFLVLAVVYLVPGLIYAVFKLSQSNTFKTEKEAFIVAFSDYDEKINDVCYKARSEFFARQ